MRVILPNGQIREYRNANYATYNPGYRFTDLYTGKDKKTWVARIPESCLIETNALEIEKTSDDRRLQQLEFKIDRLLKTAMRKPREKISPGIQRVLMRNKEKTFDHETGKYIDIEA